MAWRHWHVNSFTSPRSVEGALARRGPRSWHAGAGSCSALLASPWCPHLWYQSRMVSLAYHTCGKEVSHMAWSPQFV